LREWAVSARVQHHHKFISLNIYFNTTNAQQSAALNRFTNWLSGHPSSKPYSSATLTG
jgi:hypothetical protein